MIANSIPNHRAPESRALEFPAQNINAEKFDEELRALLGDTYVSMDTSDAGILVRLTEKADKADEQVVADHFAAHDPAEKSAAEVKRAAHQDALARLAALDVDALDAKIKGGSDPVLSDILTVLRDVKTYFEGLL